MNKKRAKISAFIIAVILLILLIITIKNTYASTSNSTNYKLVDVVVTTGGDSVNSTNYKNIVGLGFIAKVLNSSNFLNKLGFLHGILLANNQPCTSNNQCESGICCNSICQSTSCTTATVGGGGGGGGGETGVAGGGGGGIAVTEVKKEEIKDFSISKSSLKFSLNLGDSSKDKITVRNTGNAPLSFSVALSQIEDFVSLSDASFELQPGEIKNIDVEVLAKRIGSYYGEITFASSGISKAASMLLDIKSEQVLFDVKLDIPPQFKQVTPNSDLRMQITLLNVGAPKNVDATVTYAVRNKVGAIIHESSETFAVEKQKSYLKQIKIPQGTPYGEYIASIEVRYAKSFAVSSEIFSVVNEIGVTSTQQLIKRTLVSNIYYVLVAAIAVSMLILYAIYRRASKRK